MKGNLNSPGNRKSLLCVWLFALMLGGVATHSHGQTRYVVDELQINLRSGAGNEFRILRQLRSGTKLTVLEIDASETWAKVQTTDGEEGWVLTQYIGEQPIARDLLANAQRELAQATTQQQNLAKENTELKQSTSDLQSQLQASQEQVATLSSELEDIKRISSSSLELNTRHQQLMREHQSLQTQLDVANAEINRLSDDSNQTWFLYGALAVAIGVILTLIVQSIKSRRRYSEWR